MKKNIGRLSLLALIPAVLFVGCRREIDSPSPPVGPLAATVTATRTLGATATWTSSPTATPARTQTPTPSKTSTSLWTSTPTGTPTPTPSTTDTTTATATLIVTSTPTSQTSQLPVNLGSAVGFVVLGYTTITNSGPTTLCGDLGLSPGSAVVGAPVVSCGGVYHVTDTAAANAMADLTIAYNDAAGRTNPTVLAGNIGGQTLAPGLYKSTGSLEVSSGDLTLDGQGDPNAVFIFQIASTLTTTPGRQVLLAGGAKATNVFWQVGSMCALDTTTSFVGTIMAYNQVTLNTGAVLVGRAFSEIDEVTLLSNTITEPSP